MDWPALGRRVRAFRVSLRRARPRDVIRSHREVIDLIQKQPCSSDPRRGAVLFDLTKSVIVALRSMPRAAKSQYDDLVGAMDALVVREINDQKADWLPRTLSFFTTWLVEFVVMSRPLALLNELLVHCMRASRRAHADNRAQTLPWTVDACAEAGDASCAHCAARATEMTLTAMTCSSSSYIPVPAGLLPNLAWVHANRDKMPPASGHILMMVATRILCVPTATDDCQLAFRGGTPPAASQLVSIANEAWACLAEHEGRLRAEALGGTTVVESTLQTCVASAQVLALCCSTMPRGAPWRLPVIRMFVAVARSAAKLIPGLPLITVCMTTCMIGVHMLVHPDDPFAHVLLLLPHVRRAMIDRKSSGEIMASCMMGIVEKTTGYSFRPRDILTAFRPGGDLLCDVAVCGSVFLDRTGRCLAGTDGEPTHWCHYAGCANFAGPSELALKTFRCGEEGSACSARYCGRECQVAAWRAGHSRVCRGRIVP